MQKNLHDININIIFVSTIKINNLKLKKMKTKEQKREEAIKANELLKTDKKEQAKLARQLRKLGLL